MDSIGKYQNLIPLARGGSGQLYKSYDSSTGRHVAIKVLVATDDQRQLKRFSEEARAAGKLQHPNVINIYASDMDNGRPFLVMEFLEGQDLSKQLKSGTRIPLFEAVEIMYQVAKGLAHAHSNGVIHRDITPQNIWLLPDGTAKIIDFGFASNLLDTQGSWHRDPGGTLHYMSPEHITNEDPRESEAAIDARSDVFSYGTVFYQLVCGQFPFTGEDERNVILSIQLREPIPVRTFAPECPEALAAIIHRALQKEPQARFQSFRRLLFELEPIVNDFRRQRAHQLVEKARGLLEREELEAAEDLVERAMKLVEDFQAARDLHLVIQTALEIKAARLALEAKIRAADEKLGQNDFASAIRILEQLSEWEPTVTDRLRTARASWLISDARHYHEEGRLAESLECVAKALGEDEGNVDAIQLRQTLQTEIETRKQERFQEALRDGKKSLKDKDYLTALILLEPLEKEFPTSVTVQTLLSYAREEVNKRRRDAARESTAAKVQILSAYGQFDAALEIIDQALMEYPADPVLIKLKEATIATMRPRGATIDDIDRFPCSQCGNLLPPSARYCDRCGNPVTN